ncbi:MAG: NADP-dependent malic enzyme [Leptospiraceae bacterium]|nr:NADP-dependent malic enzyme [Leptospiraceae bacterium]
MSKQNIPANKKQEALDYHSSGKPGKIEVIPTKSHSTQRDLSLAYSPGVAEPCLEIAKNPEDVYKYTSKGNLVAVISNGTAVLGLGDIGALAGKPVMEGKGMLFKIYAGIDVFDIEVDTKNVDEFIRTVKAIAPTFGGINLEDIKAPECFEIETRLKEELDIPLMHDDQHGTAIISAAALINACELTKKDISKVKLVINGAGAAAISCAKLYISVGAKKENILMLDSKGVISTDRTGLDPQKQEFAANSKAKTLEDAMKGCDVFVGLSKGNIVSREMVQSMAKNPIVLALANPDPEIAYDEAIASRSDIIMATGRSDHPNQVNNVLGFPYIFRGALDVRATKINEEMKLAAVYAIAYLAKEPVPDSVNLAYNSRNLSFGKDYIIPKPIDPRLISIVSPAVAKAAMDSGVARKEITDWEEYKNSLISLMGQDNKLIRTFTEKARRDPKKVVFAEAENYKILKAAITLKEEGIAIPILLGDKEKIKDLIREHSLDILDIEIINPLAKESEDTFNKFSEWYYEKRKRKGVTAEEAQHKIRNRQYFGAVMVEHGMADAMISGITRSYSSPIRSSIQIIGMQEGARIAAGMYIITTNKGTFFFADTTVNVNPSTQDLIDITLLCAKAIKQFGITPRIGLLSYSNFGSSRGEEPNKVRHAVNYLHKNHPDLIVDGELQANFATNSELLKEQFPFSTLIDHQVNTLIFPNLSAGNIAYKLIYEIGGAEVIGPILLGLKKPMHVLPLNCSVREIVNLSTIAVVEAQGIEN